MALTPDQHKRLQEYNARIKAEAKSDAPSYKNAQSIQPAFEKALDAKQPIEITPDPPQKVTGRALSGLDMPPDYQHVKPIYPKFNDAVQNISAQNDEGRNSSMVEKEKPQYLNQPPEEMRATADRKKHNNEMQKDRDGVLEVNEAKAKAAEIRAEQKKSPQQSPGLKK